MKSEIKIDSVSTQELATQVFFVLQCTVRNGVVQKGQAMTLPYSSGLDMTIPVDEVESAVDQPGKIRIKVLCDDLSDVEFLRGLNLEGEVLSVH